MDNGNINLDLNNPNVVNEIRRVLSEDVDSYCAHIYGDSFRTHLGASLIGESCKRKLFYGFRWFKKVKHSGNTSRIFNRGHLEEARFIEWLKGIGCTVYTHDENGNQFRITDCEGHFGGSLDGVCYLPERYGIKEPLLLEFKTSGAKPFERITQSGMIFEKPLHYSQISIYGTKMQFNFCLYMCINKNDDTIHYEIVKINNNLANSEIEKARQIIFSEELPAKASEVRTSFKCKYCEYSKECHMQDFSECSRNCRSCKFSKPIENAQWVCTKHNVILDNNNILNGCESHEFFGL